MAAITVDTQRLGLPSCTESGIPVKAAEVIVAGGLVCVDTSGRALNGATTAGLKCAGVARTGLDNTSGADGVLTDYAEARVVEVMHHQAFAFTCNGSPVIGAAVWLVDNNTVTTVAGNVFVGWIVQHDARGALWYVYIPGAGASPAFGAAIVTLTDSTGGSGTHDDTLADGLTATAPAAITNYTAVVNMTDPVTKAEGEAVSAALALLEDEVTALRTTVAALVTDVATQNQNDSDLAQKVKEILTALS